MNVSDELIKFTVKARLNILPTNFTLFIWDRKKDPKCTLCSHSTESIAHVLNSCKIFKNFRSRRHDRIVSKIHNFIRDSNTRFQMYENKLAVTVFPQFRNDFRHIQHCKPDIICVDRDRLCIIVEVTICYDLYMKFAFDEKSRKYTPLVEMLNSKGYNTKLVTICFGSLGTVEKSVFNSLLLFNCDKNVVKSIIKWCSISVIIAANYIWRHRLKFLTQEQV